MHAKVLAVLGLLTFIPEAAAQTVKELDDTPPWTPERYQNAVPLELPTVDAPVDALGAADATRRTRQYMRPGSSEDEADVVAPDPHYELFAMDGEIELETKASAAVRTGWDWAPAPRDFGDAEALYSSSRLIPRSAREARPYRAAGKLFGTIPGSGEFECSAAVIAPRLVLTAGHCVHDGSGGADGFFEDFVFVPAYERGDAPYREWKGKVVWVTTSWATGGDFLNDADFALIEVGDKRFGRDRIKRRLGDVVGFFGFRTQALVFNHTKQLGFPGNLDEGEIPHQVDSESSGQMSPTTVCYGSDMGRGASGGPWVENFGKPASGQDGGHAPLPNLVVGVTSFGPEAEPDPMKLSCSSILNDEFVEMFEEACARKSGNCSG